MRLGDYNQHSPCVNINEAKQTTKKKKRKKYDENWLGIQGDNEMVWYERVYICT